MIRRRLVVTALFCVVLFLDIVELCFLHRHIFWNLVIPFAAALAGMGLTPAAFINLLHAQLGEYYFGPDSAPNRDVVDFDVLDYREQLVEKAPDRSGRISLLLDMRIVRDVGRDVVSEECVQKAVLRRQETCSAVVRSGTNILACPNCGASIDLSADKCAYCGTPTGWKSPLILESLTPIE